MVAGHYDLLTVTALRLLSVRYQPTEGAKVSTWERLFMLHELPAQGVSISAIAGQTGLGRNTVRRHPAAISGCLVVVFRVRMRVNAHPEEGFHRGLQGGHFFFQVADPLAQFAVVVIDTFIQSVDTLIQSVDRLSSPSIRLSSPSIRLSSPSIRLSRRCSNVSIRPPRAMPTAIIAMVSGVMEAL